MLKWEMSVSEESRINRLTHQLDLLGSICGVLGAALCLLAVISLSFFGPSPAGTILAPRSVLLGGIAVMVFGCWLRLTAK